jgi:hypothetical protein
MGQLLDLHNSYAHLKEDHLRSELRSAINEAVLTVFNRYNEIYGDKGLVTYNKTNGHTMCKTPKIIYTIHPNTSDNNYAIGTTIPRHFSVNVTMSKQLELHNKTVEGNEYFTNLKRLTNAHPHHIATLPKERVIQLEKTFEDGQQYYHLTYPTQITYKPSINARRILCGADNIRTVEIQTGKALLAKTNWAPRTYTDCKEFMLMIGKAEYKATERKGCELRTVTITYPIVFFRSRIWVFPICPMDKFTPTASDMNDEPVENPLLALGERWYAPLVPVKDYAHYRYVFLVDATDQVKPLLSKKQLEALDILPDPII